ncbi:M48 family metallopeptidase [Mariniplasma anaerobium]|uniref:Hydrolase n=1 Tax=Mariniplasma anaerobium TaxID=2735436 RepID=A0A7U9XVI4_9MOLU|nr:SprT family zinc-dependent metalloprotease [Mariniplasma anaerobium]BCR35179.1 hydrolase [Mariniplasma anaerobium]
MEKHKVIYSKRDIWFNLEYKNIKNINLRVKPDQSVHVSVPLSTPKDRVETFVLSKAPWIFQKIKGFDLTRPMQSGKKDYVSGETFKYLGRQYRLKIEETIKKEYVTMKPGYITIHVKKKDNKKRKQKLLNEWFRNRAHFIFQEVMNEVYPLVENIVKPKPLLEIKVMTKRWGSCLKSKNTVLLNYELIKAPKHCISYVTVHELTHFVHRNHDSKFYNLLTVLMPDWKERKAILDEKIIMFI